METFDLDSHLKGVYSVFPEAQHQPIIGISANYEGVDATLRDRYYKQVIAAGGTPVIIPPVADTDVIINTLQHLGRWRPQSSLDGRGAFATPTQHQS